MDKKIARHLSKDPVLKKLLQTHPPPDFRQSAGLFPDLLRSIVGQQLSGKAAETIHRRFLNLFDDRPPTAETLLTLDTDTLRSAGLSRQKASYLQNVADFFLREKIEHSNLTNMDDETIIQYLTQIKGVGRWTVEMILMFSLNRPDILPLDDLGIQKGMARLYQIEEKGKALKNKMTETAAPWRPYRSYACWYLWQSLK
ncbi:MAG TPA: DNA-3-methyladenine glycosylase 2 family protein [Bacteroidetes bacterium]|nr:DNA-3-methyladenine glycosylase 2 family protein [Bacteroidota bacterium]